MIELFFDDSNGTNERFLTVHGYAGIGKSALARQTCTYVKQRNLISGGIIHINGRKINDFDEFHSKVISVMQTHPSGLFQCVKSKKKKQEREFETLKD